MHLAGMIAVAALAATPRGPHRPHFVGERHARDSALVTPAPFPPERTDDAARPERARVWVSRSPVGSRSPIHEQVGANPGPAHYGVATDADEDRILVRVGHTPIAIGPFTHIHGGGSLKRLERARNIWLAEQGYVLHVRTHVNDRAFTPPRAPAAGASLPDRSAAGAAETAPAPSPPKPRAIIRIERDEPRKQPARMRV